MFGLEKEKKKQKVFEFDLEKDIHKHPKKTQEILHKAQNSVEELKKTLKAGKKEEDFESLGILLHAYTSLQRVIKKAKKT